MAGATFDCHIFVDFTENAVPLATAGKCSRSLSDCSEAGHGGLTEAYTIDLFGSRSCKVLVHAVCD